ASLFVVGLGSCSYPYALRATVLDGRIAIIVDPSSQRRPQCFESIQVMVDLLSPDLDARGDTYWRQVAATGSCSNLFPALYGAPMKDVLPDSSQVAAKPLRLGVIYHVGTTSGGSGYGAGRFTITSDRRIQNLD
ncbi:MAG TPA: hypothetical protein VF122_06775, partial [Caulobacteraceae bacterium]